MNGLGRMSANKRQRLLIVDGYNAIRSGSRYKNIKLPDYTDDYFNVARERLLNDVINYAGKGIEAIIVYDAAYRTGTPSEVQTVGGVRIVFSSPGQPADHVIEKLAHDARERNVETTVVTSDATIQDTVFGEGVDRMSAEGFCAELARMDDFKAESTANKVKPKSTVAARIPEDTLQALIALRDGS